MSPELNRSSFDRFVDNSEQSPTAGFAKYRSRKWNSLTYQTTFTYVRDNVWAERYYDGRLVRQLDEVSSNDGFLELREQDRGLVVRVYPDRQEFMDQGSGNGLLPDSGKISKTHGSRYTGKGNRTGKDEGGRMEHEKGHAQPVWMAFSTCGCHSESGPKQCRALGQYEYGAGVLANWS